MSNTGPGPGYAVVPSLSIRGHRKEERWAGEGAGPSDYLSPQGLGLCAAVFLVTGWVGVTGVTSGLGQRSSILCLHVLRWENWV